MHAFPVFRTRRNGSKLYLVPLSKFDTNREDHQKALREQSSRINVNGQVHVIWPDAKVLPFKTGASSAAKAIRPASGRSMSPRSKSEVRPAGPPEKKAVKKSSFLTSVDLEAARIRGSLPDLDGLDKDFLTSVDLEAEHIRKHRPQ